jgi:uncharacterized protein YbcC (UPF0753/DUF2309 family)
MPKNKCYFLNWNLKVFISYLNKTQVKYIRNKLDISIDEETNFNAATHEEILYPFEVYNIPTIETYEALVKYLDDNGYIHMDDNFYLHNDRKYTREELKRKFET